MKQREILFRGQTRRYGERLKNVAGDKMPSNWVYGGIFPQTKGGAFSIIYTYNPIEKHPVYADTVGQYTGITDKNGTKIFEGDIIKFRAVTTMIGAVEWDEKYAKFTGASLDLGCVGKYSEVIGNIYDNPDLIDKIGDV